MKNISTFLLFFFVSFFSYSQLNISLVGELDYKALHNTELSDVWGYTDETGIEYAIIGANNGTSIVSLQDPANPVEIFWEPGHKSVWRDIKTYGDYAYITNEQDTGLLVIDLSPLPSGPITNVAYYDGPNGDEWQTSHNLYIDENGVGYIFGANRDGGGVIMLDLVTTPMAPIEIGKFNDWYVHDGMARGDTLYLAHVGEGTFSIVDVSDKGNPQLLATHPTTTSATHNLWIDDSGDFLFTTDELPGAYVEAYDISDLSNIKFADKVQSSPNSKVIPHNTHYMNDYVITSYYRDGVVIHDVSNPSNMVEVGNYDSSPLSGNGYNGVWGAYPYLSSGLLLISDIEAGLLVLDPSYKRGSYLEGSVKSANTNAPIGNAKIRILSTSIEKHAAISGNYATGVATAGGYDVEYSYPGFKTDTAFNVMLTQGNVTVKNILLDPLPSFAFTGTVFDAGTNVAIPNAEVLIFNDIFTYSTMTDASGNFLINPMYDDSYEIVIGAWGWVTDCYSITITQASSDIQVSLNKGYYDDFTFNFGWTVSGDAQAGVWSRGEPKGTYFGKTFEIAPENDVSSDCFENAYVTGNNGIGPYDDDIDDGTTILTSPVFDLTGYTNPSVSFYRWWHALGPADDTMYVYLSNGNKEVLVDLYDSSDVNMGEWKKEVYMVKDFLPATSTMQFRIEVGDLVTSSGNLLEVGLDKFYTQEGTGIKELASEKEINVKVYPNPFENKFTYEIADDFYSHQMMITDLTGRVVYSELIYKEKGSVTLNESLASGVYLLEIFSEGSRGEVVKLVKK